MGHLQKLMASLRPRHQPFMAVIDSLLGSLKAQEVAGIILEYMWYQFVQIYIDSPPALKADYFALLLLLFKCFFGNM